MTQPPIPPGYVAYPRQSGPGAFGPGPQRIRVEVLAESWRLVSADWGTWALASLILYAGILALYIPFIVVMVPLAMQASMRGPTSEVPSGFVVLSVSASLCVYYTAALLSAAILNVGIRKVRGEYAVVGDMFKWSGMFGRIAAAEALMTLLYLLPALAGFAPVLLGKANDLSFTFMALGMQLAAYGLLGIVQVFAAFVPLLILDQRKTVGDAFRISFRTLAPHFFPAAGMLFLMALLGGLGLVACGVGLLFSTPLYYAAKAIMYNDFFRPEQPAPMMWDAASAQHPL